MRPRGHEKTSTTEPFYPTATMDQTRQGIEAATPAISTAPTEQLTDAKLKPPAASDNTNRYADGSSREALRRRSTQASSA